MNDNDIIKALGLCGRDASGFDMCVGCPYEKTGCLTKEYHMPHDALDLINRQKAEIERLQYICAELSKEIDHLRESANMVKADAIKGFAEMLKKGAVEVEFAGKFHYKVVSEQYIDHIMKEKTEGEDGSK